MNNQIAKIETTQLEKVVKESGLQIQEGEEIKKSYLPFVVQLSEIQAQSSKINFDSPEMIDETIARELRLKTVKIRTGAEVLKDQRKRGYLLRGNLEQAAYNLIASSCKLTEETFFNVEKARELAEKKRKEALKIERQEKLSPYTEDVVLYPLGEMSEEQFNSLYITLRTAHENRLEAERKAEEERIAKEKAESAERERIRLENLRLKKEAEERESVMAEEKRKAEEARKKQQELFNKEREKAEAERKRVEEEQRIKIEAERKERERVEAELKAKNDAIEKAKKEAEAKAEAECKAKEASEKKARLAPDKDKLKTLAESIGQIPLPKVKSLEAQAVIADVNSLLNKVINFINSKADQL